MPSARLSFIYNGGKSVFVTAGRLAGFQGEFIFCFPCRDYFIFILFFNTAKYPACFRLRKQNHKFFRGFYSAFSYIFWNQAIEAKGGIYMLNLLFFVILIYLSMELFKSYNVKC